MPTSSLGSRLALLAGSVVVSLAVAAAIWHSRAANGHHTVRQIDRSKEVRALLNGRVAPDGWNLSYEGYPPPLVMEGIDEQTAKTFFPALELNPNTFVYDPILYFTRRPHLDQKRGFPDGGKAYAFRTNGHGFRNDEEVSAAKPDVRVLVTGDSHTDGVCPNEASFPGVLARQLREHGNGRTIEVLNAAVGHYAPYNYLGVIQRWVDELTPDVFVVVLYGGNDFHDMMILQRYFHRRPAPANQPVTNERFIEWLRANPDKPRGAGSQDLQQVMHFLNNPEDEQIAIDTANTLSVEIARLCRQHGTRVLFVYLPPASAVQYEKYAEEYDNAIALFGITREQLAVTDRVADGWLAFLAEREIPHIDLRPLFAKAPEPLYWFGDLHINVNAQQRIADALTARVEALASY